MALDHTQNDFFNRPLDRPMSFSALKTQHAGPSASPASAPSTLTSSLKTQPAPRGGPADPVKQVISDMKAASAPGAKAGIVLDALNRADPKMAPKIVDAALGATTGADRAEVMGKLMKDNSKLALDAIEAKPELGSFKDADLRGVSHQALQSLPYNKLEFAGKTKFPANLDLTNNAYMGGAGVNLDNVSMPGVRLPANRHIKSAKGANFGRQPENATTAMLSIKGGEMNGMQGALSYNPSASASVTQIKPDGTTFKQEAAAQKNWAGPSTKLSPFGA